MRTDDFAYDLPEGLIAQRPVEPRDESRLLVCDRTAGVREHRRFRDITAYLRPLDALAINVTRTIPARLIGVCERTGGEAELLLLRRLDDISWEALVRPGRKLKPGAGCVFGGGLLRAEIIDYMPAEGGRVVRFSYEGVFEELLGRLGKMPLPPYIRHQTLADPAQYNTVYAAREGSAATPTAGLHFTEELLERITRIGVRIVPILLHVGLGTFRPVKAERVADHVMHEEYYEVTQGAADTLNDARVRGGRIVCVGTTTVRTLETVTGSDRIVKPGVGYTDIFLTPGRAFHATDALITNFHLPRSTLLMLVSAFMGLENALAAYEEAVREKYRFFSFGDAMLII
ncbi:MAG: tRNA preQ1(34) S-adenosylmethionine ribosyltransferase-isomerase QueA [Clostridia bacterium]|nr:tRNA preQ1(34) S-adenosylmethionine ribosyltransferase-isomerase QueA [Clostridia bacterium]